MLKKKTIDDSDCYSTDVINLAAFRSGHTHIYSPPTLTPTPTPPIPCPECRFRAFQEYEAPLLFIYDLTNPVSNPQVPWRDRIVSALAGNVFLNTVLPMGLESTS